MAERSQKQTSLRGLGDADHYVYVPPAHCQTKGILQKIITIKHRTIKDCLAIEYFSQRKQECTSDIRELVTLIERELTQCISSLEAVLKTTHKMEEENKKLKHELEEKNKIISDLSFEDIEEEPTKETEKRPTKENEKATKETEKMSTKENEKPTKENEKPTKENEKPTKENEKQKQELQDENK